MSRCELGLPAGLALGEAIIGADLRDARRAAARAALMQLGSDGDFDDAGARPLIVGDDVQISLSHGVRRVFAVAGRLRYLGVEIAEEEPRLPALALRYFATDHPFARTPRELAACVAAKGAALDAVGGTRSEGDVFDDAVVRVLSLTPPRLWCGLASLELVIRIIPEGALAIAYAT